MTIITGDLILVTNQPATVTEVWVRAGEIRTHNGGLVLEDRDREPVHNGWLEINVLPGPAILTLVSHGTVRKAIPIVVPDAEATSLEDAVNAARLAQPSLKTWLEELAASILAGTKGPKGDRGPEGKQGPAGPAPYIQNGTWWTGGVDTGIDATGPQGDPGIAPHIQGETWWVGEVDTGVPARGPKGDPGPTGTLDLIDESVQTTIDTVAIPAIEGARDEALGQVAGAVAAEVGAIRYYRRHLTVDDTMEDLESGLFFAPTSEVSQALGIPGALHGDVRISRWGVGDAGAGIVIFTSREAPAREWSGTWSPEGVWQGWQQMHAPYIAERHLTVDDTLENLDSGHGYIVPTGAVAAALGLPVVTHGVVHLVRWGPGNAGAGLAIFDTREAPSRRFSGTWSPAGIWQGWQADDAKYIAERHLTVDDTLEDLESGRGYIVPSQAVATALGLPEAEHGVVHVVWWGSGWGQVTFDARTSPIRRWSKIYHPTTISPWELTTKRVIRHLTTSDRIDALDSDDYIVPTGAVATAVGLPVPQHGSLAVRRWGTSGLGVATFDTRETPSRRYTLTWSASGPQGWVSQDVPRTPPTSGEIEWLTLFGPGHGWSTIGTNPVPIIADTDVTLAAQSLKMSPAPGQSDTLRSPDLNLDLRGKALVVWARYDSGEVNDGRTTGLQVRAYGDGPGHFLWRVIRPSGVTAHAKFGEWMQTWLVPEINQSGGGDWSNIKRIEIGTPDARIPDAREWHLQGVGVVDLDQRFQKGVVSITFDDGELENLRAARQHLTPRGWSATAYVMREYAQDPDRPWYMSEDQILELHEEHGWTIGSHNLARYLEMTDEDVDASFAADREWMTSIGLPEPRHLAWPQGAYDLAKIRVARKHFDTARSIFPGVDTLPTGDKFRIRGLTSISDSGHPLAVPLSDVKIWIDRAVRSGGWLSLVFHTLTDTPQVQQECSWEFFEQVLDYVEASGAEVLTYDQITQFL